MGSWRSVPIGCSDTWRPPTARSTRWPPEPRRRGCWCGRSAPTIASSPSGSPSWTTPAAAGEVTAAAHALAALLGACQLIERDVLVPALAALPGVDLSVLVEDVTLLLDGGILETPEILDVREIPHGRRHPRIFGSYARLAAGQSFVLVNNHDPKPLRREFQATFPDQFGWDYLESGPDRWQVRIARLSVDG